MKTRILVIDDEAKILDVVESYLAHEGFQVDRAANGRAGLDSFRLYKPDLVVLDLMLPDLSGEEVCRTIRRHSLVPILMLTARVGEEAVLSGFHLGADDYLTKPFSPRELVVRVHALLRRSTGAGSAKTMSAGDFIHTLSPSAPVLVSPDGSLVLDPDSHRVHQEGRDLELTATEFRLLELFLRNPGRAFTRDDLVRLGLGDDFPGDERTIDVHIKNLRHKLGDSPRNSRYIQTVHRLGYRFGEAWS